NWGWNWTVAKRVLEYLFFTGQVTSAGRNGAFERRYALVERVLPAPVLAAPEPPRADAVRALVAASVRALGIGTLRDVADYY
ncbi:winged helix DNA-binding domain-containing protein, partial [Listeria monocytogenes]|nr:winged helix DNA-binding domain-containing protein [Listeria monocytogenes]